MSTQPERPTCPHCGSSNVSTDATVYWNRMGGYWELPDGFEVDAGTCEDCDPPGVVFVWVTDMTFNDGETT